MNYILHLNDLIQSYIGEMFSTKESHVMGIDIGCGASCIYPLLGLWHDVVIDPSSCLFVGHKTFGWRFIATEVDEKSFECAQMNVSRNSLQHAIRVLHVASEDMLTGVITGSHAQSVQQFMTETKPSDTTSNETGSAVGSEPRFHFCMCNPPFFGLEEQRQTNPQAHCSGQGSELAAFGGEEQFVCTLISQSADLQQRVMWFTSLLGRKASIKPLTAAAKSVGASIVLHIQLFQGTTVRWVLAWTFWPAIDFRLSSLQQVSICLIILRDAKCLMD